MKDNTFKSGIHLRNNIKLQAIIAVILAISACILPLQVSAAPAEATVIFLLIPPGARAGGMGEAFVAVADDATATWWNPAGLAFINQRELTLMHVNWLPGFRSDDIYYDFVSFVNPVEDWGTFGANIVFLNLGETERRDELNTPLGTFRTFEMAVTASYGSIITPNTGLGLNVKFIYSHLADRGTGQERGKGVATNIAADLGILHHTTAPFLNRKMSLGANISNMGPRMAYIDRMQADAIPTTLRAGFAVDLIDDGYNKLTYVGEINKLLVRKLDDGTTDPFYIAFVTSWTDVAFFKDLIYNTGMEYWYTDMVALRFGYWNDELGKVKPLTYGASFKVSAYRFDFSYTAAGKGHPLTDTMRLSLSILL